MHFICVHPMVNVLANFDTPRQSYGHFGRLDQKLRTQKPPLWLESDSKSFLSFVLLRKLQEDSIFSWTCMPHWLHGVGPALEELFGPQRHKSAIHRNF